MNEFHKDILIGTLFVMGMFGYTSGEFIISSILFAAASIASNVKFDHKRTGIKAALCDWCLYLTGLILAI